MSKYANIDRRFKRVLALWLAVFCVFWSLQTSAWASGTTSAVPENGRSLLSSVLFPFFSAYDPDKFNCLDTSLTVGSQTDEIQYKMNCYGYAMRFVLYGQATLTPADGGGLNGYKQQPGEFASLADKAYVRPLYSSDPEVLMTDLVYNMNLDAARVGYTIAEYTPVSSVVPQFGSYNRLIAVVTGGYDFHFYMQHNDGTWSHKPGSAEVTDLSLEPEGMKHVLTNSNIISLANSGTYAGGCLKFFVITRDAVIDHPHIVTGIPSAPTNVLADEDTAGDYVYHAVSANSGFETGRLDFSTDEDIYYYDVIYSGFFYVWITTDSADGIFCGIYDGNDSLISSAYGDDMFCAEAYLSSGLRYTIRITDMGGNTSAYLLEIY